jgi:predicted hydrocarbon binding protein
MHGIILSELKRFVLARYGDEAWRNVAREAGRPDATYLASGVYPDEDAFALVAAASKATGKPVPALLEDFGEYIAPHLLEIYAPIMRPSWRTLDVIENTEESVHRVVRLKNPGAQPPELRAERRSPEEVVLTYASPRKMCAVAKGIGRGLAFHFGERIEIAESACMHEGAPACVISFRKRR